MELHVSSHTQRVELRDGTNVVWSAPVSTSLFGLGEEPNSFKTPRGWHHVTDKIGDDAPLNAIFESRKFTGRIWDGHALDGDLILTRILRLAGDEPTNATTFDRYIYFHGTNHEEQIGKPASHGCVRLRNTDMKNLFDHVSPGIRVYIE